MGGDVNTHSLKEYANQLVATADDNTLPAMKKYARANLEADGDFYEVAGYYPFLQENFDVQYDATLQVIKYVGSWMKELGLKLSETATKYDDNESDAVDEIWNSSNQEVPSDYKETTHYKDGKLAWNGTEIELKKPGKDDSLSDAMKMINDDVSDLNSVVNMITGIDIIEDLAAMIPDWGEFRRLAYCHGQLQQAYLDIRGDISSGMDYVASQWNGDAATAFEYHIREHWLVALETVADYHTSVQDGLTALASEVDAVVVSVNFFLGGWTRRLRKAVKDVGDALYDGWETFKTLKALASELIGFFSDLKTIITSIATYIKEFFEAIASGVEVLFEILSGDLNGIETS